jgi:hypothetical protein
MIEDHFYDGDPAGFAEHVLDEVQEYMIEWVMKGGWPLVDPDRPHDRQSAARLPPPHAALEENTLHLWYGDRHRPALRLPLITEDELRSLREEAERGDDEIIGELWGGWIGAFLRFRELRGE